MRGKQLYLFGLKSDSSNTPPQQKIKLPLDILTIASVVFVLSLIISFSLGVEKGKKIASSKIAIEPQERLPRLDVAVDKQSVEPDSSKQDSLVEEKIVPNEIVKNKQKYNIQVASFYKENTARKEAEQLKENGYPTSVSRKGKYVVIYVGDFDDEGEAKSNFELLQKRYKDCILRQL
ncbi:MAG: SPOR domain-containing protein [Candidatus Omnitrophica bacterium]|nr:SPOR domain-containing protein [Candidatus Omnitrophota bacterium]